MVSSGGQSINDVTLNGRRGSVPFASPACGAAMVEVRLVSIIVCAYNAGPFLVPSIRSALEQTYTNLEILVVDDGSTDGSVDDAKRTFSDPRIRWFRQENSGKPVALNRALDEARGEFCAIQDADDLSKPRRIKLLLDYMDKSPEVAAVYSGHDLIIGSHVVAPTFRAKSPTACCKDIDALRMPAHDPTAMYRMSMVGGMRYSPDLPVVEGYDFILRVGEKWPMAVVGECLYSYRVHETSVTRADPARRRRLVLEVHRRAHERRSLPYREPQHESTISRSVEADNNLAAHFIQSVLDQRDAGYPLRGLTTGLRCSCLNPMVPHYHKALAYALVPQWVIRRIRRRHGT